MIAEILGEDVSLDFHPNSVLSKAHQAERKADLLAGTQDFNGALDCYSKAQELIQEVVQIPGNKFVQESLQCQLEHLKKQPSVIRRKKEDFERRKRQKSAERRKKLEQERLKVSVKSERLSAGDDDFDGDKLVVEVDPAEDETKSLLACLNDNIIEEGDGFTYKTTELKKFFSTQQSICQESDKRTHAEESITSDSPKGSLIKKLERQNKELMEHICHLFKSWNSCEEENKQLKEKLKHLEQELETLKSNSGLQKSVLDHPNIELTLPFQSGYFGDSPIPSLPSLPPLDLPSQLQMSGLHEEEDKHVFQEEM